jgi:hypothetical protein
MKLALLLARNSFDFFDNQLCDGHSGLKDNSRRSQVDHLQRQVASEAWMNGWRGKVNEQSDSCPAALSFNASRKAYSCLMINRMVKRQLDGL